MKTEYTIRELADRSEERGGEGRKPGFRTQPSGFKALNVEPVLRARAFRAARSARGASAAFSLIELLVVIGVIVILASLTFPVLSAVKRAQAIKRAQGELSEIETAIEAYHTKLGFYPPDNAPNWYVNPLYYELLGTTATLDSTGKPVSYQTLDGSPPIRTVDFPAAFGGSRVVGFMNSASAGAGDDKPNAVKFLRGLKPAQFLAVTTPAKCTLLGITFGGSPDYPGLAGDITPYGYNSSNPVHNPKSFDLWVDIVVGDKTNRISNWSTKPILVYYPSVANSYP